MNVFATALLAIEHRLAAGWRSLDQPRTLRLAAWLMPVLFGLLSMRAGQDANWDLLNYHIYNAYAFLNGKIGYDLAPAQFQSYFNPTLDLLYYGLVTHLPGRAVSFIMGYLHGWNAVLLLGVTRQVLQAGEPGAAGAARHRLPLMLTLAGCLGVAFLSQLGNTMGDNMTSLCVLGALLLLLRAWPQLLAGGARGALAAALAGLVMGAGAGLKLTNASYALALCLALLTLNGGFWLRVRSAFVFGLGVLAGIGISAGHWYWKMWQVFGNPLFPQFNDKFKGPLAAPIGIADTGWLPKNWLETLLWPFIFTFHPRRVIELPMTQIIWPIVYIAFIVLALYQLRSAILGAAAGNGALAPRPARATAPAGRLVLVFFVLSYLLWLKLFAIYRYLVPLEMLAPLVFWLLLHRLFSARLARGVGAWCLALAALAVFPVSDWGHTDAARVSFSADVPPFAQPDQSMVFTVLGDPPMAWAAPLFPRDVAFVSLGSGFPESEAYKQRVIAMVASRKGPFYMMVTARGLPLGPQAIPAQVGKSDAAPYMQSVDGAFKLVRADPATMSANRFVLDAGQEVLGRYGMMFHEESCVAYAAHIGKGDQNYQLCKVKRK